MERIKPNKAKPEHMVVLIADIYATIGTNDVFA